MVWQLAAILGLSTVLGFAFNSANPVGVQFALATESASADAPVKAKAVATDSAVVTPVQAATPVTPVPPVTGIQTPSVPVVTQVAVPSAPAPVPVTIPATNPPAKAVATTVTTPPPPAPTPIPTHWKEVKPLLAVSNIVLVDVRPKGAYDAGHIPGAISLPEASTPDEFDAFVKQYPTNTPLICYCSSTSCSVSFRVAKKMMQQYNYSSVKYMTGGYLEYQKEELAPPQPAPQASPKTNPPAGP